MPLRIVRNDITKMNTEAIVNTANRLPMAGPGCDRAVYQAAGYEELLQYRQQHIGIVEEGEVFLTPGFGLQARVIIHAVSPLYQGGDGGEEKKLRSCYRKSLALAKKEGIGSIAFPLIATGSFGYPKEEGLRIAADEIQAFLLKNHMEIYLVVFGEVDTTLGKQLCPDLEAYIDEKYVEAAWEEEYGAVCSSIDMVEVDRSIGNRPGISGRQRNIKEKFLDHQKKAILPKDIPSQETQEEPVCLQADYGVFEELHESRLEERMRHLSDTFSEYLLYLIKEKHMTNAEVYKRAIVDKKIFSKIKNNAAYHPNKMTALCLCVGARLNLDETKDLLARAGYALSPCDKTDIIFSYFIENGIYDMIELDIQLEEHGLPCIIS
ncbi:MAG: macro domain-containing protein [Lachnospiraceae bacterium]|nr:macro domain-containing protein [Lachnospiraceae bacterium]